MNGIIDYVLEALAVDRELLVRGHLFHSRLDVPDKALHPAISIRGIGGRIVMCDLPLSAKGTQSTTTKCLALIQKYSFYASMSCHGSIPPPREGLDHGLFVWVRRYRYLADLVSPSTIAKTCLFFF